MWPFTEPRNTATFASRHIFTGDVICHVYHSWEDGSWSFLPDRETQSEDCLIVCLHNIYERDPSIGDLADLPYGWKATRAGKDQPWERVKDHPYAEHSTHGYYLIELANYPTVQPRPPCESARKNLAPGDLVKLFFRFSAEDAPFEDYDTERMWVSIQHVDDDEDRYQGVLDNDPKHEGIISCGDSLWFSPNHVFAIHG